MTTTAERPAGATADDPQGPRRDGLAHAVALVRSAVYSAVATVFFVLVTLAMSPVLLFPKSRTRWALNGWAAADLVLLRVIVGQRIRVLGRENIPAGPALVASKHQSAWETMALLPLLPNGRVILKKELLSIPLYGAFARHYGMISVDRSAGAAALKQLAIDAERVIADGGQIVIFPEGTRRALGAPPDYKPGAIFLYDRLGVPIVPVAVNSGLLWPRHRFVRYPGTVTVSFLPPIPPGLDRKVAQRRLIDAIETETARIVAAP